MNSNTRIPFLFVVKSKIIKEKDKLVLMKKESKEKVDPAHYSSIIVSSSCSVSASALFLCQQTRTMVMFTNHTGSKLYYVPANLKANELVINQYKAVSKPKTQIKLIKRMISQRNKILKKHNLNCLIKTDGCKTSNDFLLSEARSMKELYRLLGIKYQRPWLGRPKEKENKSEILYNNAILYTLCNIALLQLGLDPNLGILHSHKKRNGLVYDIADLIKLEESLVPGFQKRKIPLNNKALYKKIIKLVKKLLES